MPGICGIIYYEKETSLTNELDLMAAHLKHEPSEHIICHADKNMGMLHITGKNSVSGKEPFRLPSKAMLITDARIENKKEIIRLTGLKPPANSVPDDTEIIAAAYQRFGNHCIDILKGRFTFAVYEQSSGKFTFGRDHSGNIPLFYTYRKNRFLAFASDIHALLALPVVEEKLDKDQIVRFVMSAENDTFPAGRNTLYRHIYSVPPENCMEIGPGSTWTMIHEHIAGKQLNLRLSNVLTRFWRRI